VSLVGNQFDGTIVSELGEHKISGSRSSRIAELHRSALELAAHDQFDEAIARFGELLNEAPDCAEAVCDRAVAEASEARARSPYLFPDDAALPRWRQQVREVIDAAPQRCLAVGIAWHGGNDPAEMRRRSIPLMLWRDILRVPQAIFVNLQHGDLRRELHVAHSELGTRLYTWDDADPFTSLDDFAALVASLDLVISVDNSTVHLAGALGVPTWAIVSFPSSSYWRWFGESSQTPWYSSVRLFRRRADSGDHVFGEMGRELRTLVESQTDRA